MAITQETHDNIKADRASGMTIAALMKKYKLSKRTIDKHCADARQIRAAGEAAKDVIAAVTENDKTAAIKKLVDTTKEAIEVLPLSAAAGTIKKAGKAIAIAEAAETTLYNSAGILNNTIAAIKDRDDLIGLVDHQVKIHNAVSNTYYKLKQ